MNQLRYLKFFHRDNAKSIKLTILIGYRVLGFRLLLCKTTICVGLTALSVILLFNSYKAIDEITANNHNDLNDFIA